MTLVEVLIVVALIAMLSGAIVYGSGMLSSNRQRAAATLIMGAVRLGITRANATGLPVRLVFDLEEQRLMLEESSSRRMLRDIDDESTAAGAEPATEAERLAREEADRILEGPSAARPRFTPVKQFGFDADDPEKGRSLGPGIVFREVQSEHDPEPLRSGRAYLYVWPGGRTERAVVALSKDGANDDDALSVVVSSLTGRARIERGRFRLPEPRSDGEFSEREEP
jgi:general secretion pathway protein H